MFSIGGTILLYDFLLIIGLLLCNYKSSNNLNRIHSILAFIILFFFSLIRYDIGADYENTYYDVRDLIYSIKSGLQISDFISGTLKEPAFFILTYLFRNFSNPCFFVVGSYSFIFFFFLYKFLDKFRAHFWGVFLLFISLSLFQSWDWMKQGSALAIGLCSLYEFNSGNTKKSLFLLLFACCFHYSVCVLLILFLLNKKITVNTSILAFVLIPFLILSSSGIFEPIYYWLLSVTPLYGDIYTNSSYSLLEEYTYNSIPFVFTSIWYIILLFMYNRKCDIWSLSLFIGALLFIISGGSLLLDRMSWYFSASQFVIFPQVVQKAFSKKKKIIVAILILCSVILLNRRYFTYGEVRGCVPYQTVFSHESSLHQFRSR